MSNFSADIAEKREKAMLEVLTSVLEDGVLTFLNLEAQTENILS